jgi:tetratricopeptide (TPR) repeat protein
MYSSGRYFDCIAETRRLISMDIPAEEKNSFRYFIGSNYFLGGQYNTVVSDLDKITVPDNNFPYVLLKSQAYLKLNDNDSAAYALKVLAYDRLDGRDRNVLLLRKIDILLQDSRYEEIVSEIETAEKYSIIIPENMKSDISRYGNISVKNKWMAVSMSAIIPGAGQVYSGRYIDGAISILSVAAASYGAYHFRETGDRPLSITSGFFAALFYCGNIYGAYNSAERATADSDREFRVKFQRQYIPEYNPAFYFDFTANFK